MKTENTKETETIEEAINQFLFLEDGINVKELLTDLYSIYCGSQEFELLEKLERQTTFHTFINLTKLLEKIEKHGQGKDYNIVAA